MFVYNLKVNSGKLFKIILTLLIIARSYSSSVLQPTK